ncbi:MAG: ATP-binding protein [Cyanobacteria bacterium J06626_23]
MTSLKRSLEYLFVVGTVPPSAHVKWDSLSFASTLYLHPIVDTLLDPIVHHVPSLVCHELRLGLQEALVNAAKHGNQLNPAKQVSVQYARRGNDYWWIVSDQGTGFKLPNSCGLPACDEATAFAEECGRGLFILYQIFDDVHWEQDGRALHLRKRIARPRWQWPATIGRLWPTGMVLKQGA